MEDTRRLKEMQEEITREIMEKQNKENAGNIIQKRKEAKIAGDNYKKGLKAMEAAGLKIGMLDTFDMEAAEQADTEIKEIRAQMVEESQEPLPVSVGLDVESTFLPDKAQLLRPIWSASFSDDDLEDKHTGEADVSTQALIGGGGCKDYYNWARGAGSGLFGTGVGKIQSWVYFGFWFKPPTSRFYSIRPLFRFRGFTIVRADDGFFSSKRAEVKGTAWTNVHQYNWKGWNSVDVYRTSDDNINQNRRRDIDRYTYNSYLLGGGDWAWISCVIGLYAYARGGGSYAENNFSTGNANYLCVPHVYVI
jgi:hypothetical protein